MEIKLQAKLPKMPNFILFEGSNHKIPISQLSYDEAKEMAAGMQTAFMNHWRKMSEQPND